RCGRQRDQCRKLVAPVELEDVGGEQRRHTGDKEERAGEGGGALRRGSPAAQRGEAPGQPGDDREREQRSRGGAAVERVAVQEAGQRLGRGRGGAGGADLLLDAVGVVRAVDETPVADDDVRRILRVERLELPAGDQRIPGAGGAAQRKQLERVLADRG